jgi:hypothetical protein
MPNYYGKLMVHLMSNHERMLWAYFLYLMEYESRYWPNTTKPRTEIYGYWLH